MKRPPGAGWASGAEGSIGRPRGRGCWSCPPLIATEVLDPPPALGDAGPQSPLSPASQGDARPFAPGRRGEGDAVPGTLPFTVLWEPGGCSSMCTPSLFSLLWIKRKGGRAAPGDPIPPPHLPAFCGALGTQEVSSPTLPSFHPAVTQEQRDVTLRQTSFPLSLCSAGPAPAVCSPFLFAIQCGPGERVAGFIYIYLLPFAIQCGLGKRVAGFMYIYILPFLFAMQGGPRGMGAALMYIRRKEGKAGADLFSLVSKDRT